MAVEHPHSARNKKGIFKDFEDKHVPNSSGDDLPDVGGWRSGDVVTRIPARVTHAVHGHHPILKLLFFVALLVLIVYVMY